MLYSTSYSIFPLKTLHRRSCEGLERCRQGSSFPLPRSAAPASQKEIDSNELNVAVHFCRWNICASRTDGRATAPLVDRERNGTLRPPRRHSVSRMIFVTRNGGTEPSAEVCALSADLSRQH